MSANCAIYTMGTIDWHIARLVRTHCAIIAIYGIIRYNRPILIVVFFIVLIKAEIS